MGKTKQAEIAETTGGARSKYQGYECVEVHRSQLKNAPYNPRVLSDKQRRKLRAGIEKLRLLEPPTWNVTTGNIVGGHQRISIIDALEGTADYRITVSQVSLTPKEEVEANVLLNNGEAQGDWDIAKLEAILRDGEIDIAATGFDMADVYRMFGEAPVAARAGAAEILSQQIRDARQAYDNSFKANEVRDENEFYLVFVFRDEATRTGFLAELKLDDSRYQDGRELLRLLKRSPLAAAQAAGEAGETRGEAGEAAGETRGEAGEAGETRGEAGEAAGETRGEAPDRPGHLPADAPEAPEARPARPEAPDTRGEARKSRQAPEARRVG
jgi:hypothetical protein